jgi:uroporphyrin-III C-methyltransferase
MGMRKLADIMAIFAAQGKKDTPAMVVQNGSTPDEKVVLGSVSNLAERVALADASSPGIIVVGEVVALHSEFKKAQAEAIVFSELGTKQASITL